MYNLYASRVREKGSRRGIGHLTREPEARGLQPAQTLSRCHVATAVAGREVLEDGPDHPHIASLDALADIVQEAFAFLRSDAALW